MHCSIESKCVTLIRRFFHYCSKRYEKSTISNTKVFSGPDSDLITLQERYVAHF